MVRRPRRQFVYPTISPALFLVQALRSLEEAQKLETTPPTALTFGEDTNANKSKAFSIYSTLVQTFQTVFGVQGPAGQDRIKPLNDRHLLLQIAHVARDAKDGFNRTHEALPVHVVVNIRSNYYPSPSYPAQVDYAVTWLESQADAIKEEETTATKKTADKGKGKAKADVAADGPPTLPAVPVTAAPEDPATECQVCMIPFVSDVEGEETVPLPDQAPTPQCAHLPAICANCLQQTIASHIEQRGAAHAVSCPDSNCASTLSRDDVKRWASETTFARWDMLSLRELMRADESRRAHAAASSNEPEGSLFIWCQNPTCYSGQLHPSGDAQPEVICIRCNSKICFTHNVLWHEGKTCKQYDRSRPIKDVINRGLNRATIWWNTRNCPGCFQPIQKNSGCRHMHCRCGYYFTWWYAPIHWRRFMPFVRARSPGL